MNYKYKQRLKLNIKCNAHFEVDQHDNCISTFNSLNGMNGVHSRFVVLFCCVIVSEILTIMMRLRLIETHYNNKTITEI